MEARNDLILRDLAMATTTSLMTAEELLACPTTASTAT
jgi:hypothetical protein